MKTNFTSIKYAIILAIFFSLSFNATAQAPIFNFSSTPILLSGTHLAIGAQYKFTNVANGTNAIVTILGATGGASVAILDDNSLTKPEAFSPQVTIPANVTGMVEFKIDFYDAVLNTPKTMTQVVASAIDIDGSNGAYHEKDAFNMGAGGTISYQASPIEINVVRTGNEVMGTNVAGMEYVGVDTTAKGVMFTFANNNISSFTYKAGAINLQSNSINRQKGIYFKAFNYPNIVVLPVKYVSFNAIATDKALKET